MGANDACIQTLGLNSFDELKGKTDYDLLQKELAEKVWQNDQQIMNENKSQTFEEIAIAKDRSKAIYLSKKAPLHNKQGKVIGIIGIAIDITENKRKISQLEKQFVDQLMILDKVIAASPGHIYWMDKNGALLGCNELQAKNLGLNSRADIVGKKVPDLQPKELAKKIIENNNKVMEQGKEEIFEEYLFFNGKNVIYKSHKAPMRDNSGNIIGLIGTSIDITDSKKVEALEQEKMVTQKTIKFMEMLAGNIAHELRTPLAIIKLNVELLEGAYASKQIDAGEKETILTKTLQLIKHVIKSSTYILDNILVTLKNVAKGKVDGKTFARQSISDNIEDALAHYPFEGEERSLVEWHKTKGFEYLGDDILTRHIIFNLIKNALRAIKDAGKGKIIITLKEDKKSNQLIFRDTALGIPADYLAKVFDRFESNEASKTGSGLGLSFCKTIMQSYNGKISCSSKKGVFTEFVLDFPKIN
jgi:PAS domain S-box-containing protein